MSSSRLLVAMLGVIMLISCAENTKRAVDQGVAHNAEVVMRSKFPPYTGLVRTWVVLTVRNRSGSVEILFPYFDDTQKVPELGDVCDFRFSVMRVNGIAGEIVIDSSANVLEAVDCHNSGVRARFPTRKSEPRDTH